MKKNTQDTFVSEGEDARETDHAFMSSQMITYIFLLPWCLFCVFYIVYSVCGGLAKKSSWNINL